MYLIQAMLTVSDRIQIPCKRLKNKGTQIDASYFISLYTLNAFIVLLAINTAVGFLVDIPIK